jgi:hypothetical protein
MIEQGFDPIWADAAFRAFDLNFDGELSFYEFILADVSLKLTDEYTKNEFWLALRRRVIFTVYDRTATGQLGRKEFVDLLEDMSGTEGPPIAFGIKNSLWLERQHSNKTLIADEFSLQSVTQELALSKLEIAQKDFSFQELHLVYLRLEKQVCEMKLENAKLRSQLDEFKGLPRDVRKVELNGIEDSLFDDDHDVHVYHEEGEEVGESDADEFNSQSMLNSSIKKEKKPRFDSLCLPASGAALIGDAVKSGLKLLAQHAADRGLYSGACFEEGQKVIEFIEG